MEREMNFAITTSEERMKRTFIVAMADVSSAHWRAVTPPPLYATGAPFASCRIVFGWQRRHGLTSEPELR